MSYSQMMRWHRKHPRGGKPQYMGFDAFSSRPKPQEVFMMLPAGSNEWEYIGHCTVEEAFKRYPNAKRFGRFGLFNEFRCDGPAASHTIGENTP